MLRSHSHIRHPLLLLAFTQHNLALPTFCRSFSDLGTSPRALASAFLSSKKPAAQRKMWQGVGVVRRSQSSSRRRGHSQLQQLLARSVAEA